MGSNITYKHVVFSLVAAASSLIAGTATAQAPDPQKLVVARALFDEASAAMERKDYATACPKLEEVVRLVPEGVGASITLGECYEGAGRLASAWTRYVEAESTAARTKQSARQKEAHDHAENVQPRLAKLTVVVPDGVRVLPGLSVERDGVPVSSVEWGVPVPVDKGKHVVVVTATGKQRWEKTLDMPDGAPQVVTVEVPAAAASDERKIPDGPTAPESLSHRWQPGLLARVDIDPLHPGVRIAAGLTIGLFDHVELGASALLGRTLGFEPQITAFVLRGAWKPLINVAVPMFFVDGAHVGFRGAAGVQWDVNRHFGVFAQVGGGYFVSAPPGYANVVFLPAVGVQGRL